MSKILYVFILSYSGDDGTTYSLKSNLGSSSQAGRDYGVLTPGRQPNNSTTHIIINASETTLGQSHPSRREPVEPPSSSQVRYLHYGVRLEFYRIW